MRKYRSRQEIIADILNVVSRNERKTKIMYEANLSFKVLQRYLKEMTTAQLISFQEENRQYRLEDKGRKFLESYRRYSEILKDSKKRMEYMTSKKRALDDLCPEYA